VIRSLKALCRKYEVLSLLDLMEDGVHASDLAKKLTVLDAIKFVEKSRKLVKAETVKKCFKQCGSDVPSIQDVTMSELALQESDLASVAERIGIQRSDLVIEERLPEFEIVPETDLVTQLVGEFTNAGADDEVEETGADQEIPEEPPVISFIEATHMLTNLIAFAKAHSLFSEEMDLLGLKSTVKAMYNSSLTQTSIERYFQ
jgi:hypothetical protein